MSDELNVLIDETKLVRTKGETPYSKDINFVEEEFHVVFEILKGKRFWMIYQRWPKWAQFLNRKGWFFEKRYSQESAYRRAIELNK